MVHLLVDVSGVAAGRRRLHASVLGAAKAHCRFSNDAGHLSHGSDLLDLGPSMDSKNGLASCSPVVVHAFHFAASLQFFVALRRAAAEDRPRLARCFALDVLHGFSYLVGSSTAMAAKGCRFLALVVLARGAGCRLLPRSVRPHRVPPAGSPTAATVS